MTYIEPFPKPNLSKLQGQMADNQIILTLRGLNAEAQLALEKAEEAMRKEWLYQTGQFSRPDSDYPPQGTVHGDMGSTLADIRTVLAKLKEAKL